MFILAVCACSFLVPGELPAPEIFLNVSEAQEGNWVSVRCALPSSFPVTTYFFCKDGETISAHKAVPHDAAYAWDFQISNQSAGQYSCGYELKDKKNLQKKSAPSASRKLTVLPGKAAEALRVGKDHELPVPNNRDFRLNRDAYFFKNRGAFALWSHPIVLSF